LISNVCSVWGRRVIDGKGAADGSTINFDNKNYQGGIEFLTWGDPKGHLLTIRYLKNSRSLDIEYQDNIQKIKIDLIKGEDGSAQVSLDSGENKFDEKKDALFVQYLKVHPQNRDSISKNPNPAIKGFSFYEITDESISTTKIETTEKSVGAGFVVMKASEKDADLNALLDMIGEREEMGNVNKLSKPKQIYEALLNFATTKPDAFMSLVNVWKKRFSDSVEWAKSHNAIDLTKDGFIALAVNNKNEVVFTNVPAKGEAMIDWVLSNITTSGVYLNSKAFVTLAEKIK
jgi:hypothetical protein